MSLHEERLPEPLPEDPMPLARGWFEEAARRRLQPNPDAMILATADAAGRPSARVVLCKRLVADPGYLVFFTGYDSRKGRELATRPDCAAVFHWDALRRQLRIEGVVEPSPAAESDAYFASRSWPSRLAARASRQSEPVADRAALLERLQEEARALGLEFEAGRPVAPAREPEIPRPPRWGGYRLWIRTLELWAEGESRVHDRGCWRRELEARETGGYDAGRWTATRLAP